MTSLFAISFLDPPYLYLWIGLAIILLTAVIWRFFISGSKRKSTKTVAEDEQPSKAIFQKRAFETDNTSDSPSLETDPDDGSDKDSVEKTVIDAAISDRVDGVADLFEDHPSEPTEDYFEEDDSIFDDTDSSSIELNLISESDSNFLSLSQTNDDSSAAFQNDQLLEHTNRVANEDTDVGLGLETMEFDELVDLETTTMEATGPVENQVADPDENLEPDHDDSDLPVGFVDSELNNDQLADQVNMTTDSGLVQRTEHLESPELMNEQETRQTSVDSVSINIQQPASQSENPNQESERLRTEIEIQSKQITELQAENDGLKLSVESRNHEQEKIRLREQELEELKSSVAVFQQKLEAAAVEKSNLAEELAHARERAQHFEAKTSALSALEKKIEDMEAEFNHALTEKANLAQQLQESRQTQVPENQPVDDSAIGELADTSRSDSTSANTGQNVAELEMMLEQAENHRTVLAVELSKLRRRLKRDDEASSKTADLEKQLEMLKASLLEKESKLQDQNELQTQLGQLESRLRDSLESTADSATRLVKLEGELAAKETELEKQEDQGRVQSQTLISLKSELQGKTRSLEELIEQFETTKETFASMKLSLAEKQDELDKAIATKIKIESDLQRSLQATGKINQLADELAIVKKQYSESQLQLEQNKTDFFNQSKFVEELKAELGRATSQSQQISAGLNETNLELSQLKLDNQALKSGIAQKQSDLDTAQKTIDRFSSLSSEKETIEKELQKLKSNIADAQQAEAGLKQIAELAAIRESTLESKVVYANDQLLEIRAERDRLSKQLEEVKRQIKQQNGKPGTKQKSLGFANEGPVVTSSSSSNSGNSEKELNRLTRQIEKLQSDSEKAKAKLGRLNDDKNVVVNDLKIAKAESDELRKQNAAFRRRVKKLEASLETNAANPKSSTAGISGQQKRGKADVKTTRRKTDKLELIDGIGPKIKDLLIRNKINTFQKLAKLKIGELRKILSDAGPSFSRHNPKTWARQSRLAAAGKWEELKRLQDQLSG